HHGGTGGFGSHSDNQTTAQPTSSTLLVVNPGDLLPRAAQAALAVANTVFSAPAFVNPLLGTGAAVGRPLLFASPPRGASGRVAGARAEAPAREADDGVDAPADAPEGMSRRGLSRPGSPAEGAAEHWFSPGQTIGGAVGIPRAAVEDRQGV